MSLLPTSLRAKKRITVEKYDGQTGTLIGTESVLIDKSGDDALSELNSNRSAVGLPAVTMDEALKMAQGEA